MKFSKRQIRAKRKAKVMRLVRMHAKRNYPRGVARPVTVVRSRFVLEAAR